MAAEYAHPEMLAETFWLAGQVLDGSLRLIDCREPAEYAAGHIPGALALPVHNYIKDEGGIHVMGAEAFAQLMGDLGVGDTTTVVTYDANGGLSATRLWWALNYYGHTRTRVLNGALQKWAGEGRPVTTEAPAPPARATFTARPIPAWIARKDDVHACIQDPGSIILDVRSAAEHTGAEPRKNRRAGHIPRAIHLEWTRALDSEGTYRVWRQPVELRALFENAGVTPDHSIIVH